MKRRTFTASLAALAASPAMPIGLSAANAPQSTLVPAGTYAWAKLIAQAQNRCSPTMLARQLRLPAVVAQQLFADLLRDGVLKAPIAGVAQAAKPINATAAPARTTFAKIPKLLPSEERRDKAPPLVKADRLSLESDTTKTEEATNASPKEPVQKSPA